MSAAGYNFGITSILLGAAWVVFFGWTLRTLWRPIHSRYSQIVYLLGVRAIGLSIGVLCPIIVACGDWGTIDPELPKLMFMTMALGTPAWMWLGYASGRIAALFLGLPKDLDKPHHHGGHK